MSTHPVCVSGRRACLPEEVGGPWGYDQRTLDQFSWSYEALDRLLVGCYKKDPSPEEQLPPATQTGANTFGCLVNGEIWTPKGFDGISNYSISYNQGLNGGLFSLMTYRYPDKTSPFQI